MEKGIKTYLINALLILVLLVVLLFTMFNHVFGDIMDMNLDSVPLILLGVIAIYFIFFLTGLFNIIQHPTKSFKFGFIFAWLSVLIVFLAILSIKFFSKGDAGYGSFYLVFFLLSPLLGVFSLISWISFLVSFLRNTI